LLKDATKPSSSDLQSRNLICQDFPSPNELDPKEIFTVAKYPFYEEIQQQFLVAHLGLSIAAHPGIAHEGTVSLPSIPQEMGSGNAALLAQHRRNGPIFPLSPQLTAPHMPSTHNRPFLPPLSFFFLYNFLQTAN